MRRLLYDTSVYVDYLRSGDLASSLESSTAHGLVHLSAVVAEELLVGAPSQRAVRFLLGLVDRFDALGRLETPSRLDWLRAGQVLRQVGRRHGYGAVRKARLTNDVLIASTALRLGATLVTRNTGDFGLFKDHLPVSLIGL